MNKNEATKIIADYDLEQEKLANLNTNLKELKSKIANERMLIRNRKKGFYNAKQCLTNRKKYIEHLESKYPNLKYISGYRTVARTDKQGRYFKVWVQDRVTKIRFWVGCSNLRRPNYTGDPLLTHRSHIYKKDLKKYDLLIEQKHHQNKPIVFYPCLTCGKVFEQHYNSRFCSKKCRNKWENRLREKRKSKRTKQAKQNGKYDKGITLEKLYKRDHGICYLCGKQLNLNAPYNDPLAPTIEHVIPIIKGGTHTWDNVRLACRSCNNKKGSKFSKEYIQKAS